MIQLKILKAYGELIIVKRKVIKETKSGIIIADASSNMGSMEFFEGKVIAVGDKVKYFQKGDWVIFGRNIFARMIRDGKEFVLLYERDVCCTERTVTDDYVVKDSEFIRHLEDKE